MWWAILLRDSVAQRERIGGLEKLDTRPIIKLLGEGIDFTLQNGKHRHSLKELDLHDNLLTVLP